MELYHKVWYNLKEMSKFGQTGAKEKTFLNGLGIWLFGQITNVPKMIFMHEKDS